MIDRIVHFSIDNRALVLLATVLFAAVGLYCAVRLPIDAVPDITTNQVQINSMAPAFAPEEMEKLVTYPIEVAMGSVPEKQEVRSLSRFGLSQVTITFPDSTDILKARQHVLERILEVQEKLPPGVRPEMAPITTGLGEIYQFAVEARPGFEDKYSLMDLRTILDWNVVPALRTVPGVIEVNVNGGLLKQYEVRVNPERLIGYGIGIHDVIAALERNNGNVGGAYFETGGEQQLIRGVGMIRNPEDISDIVVSARGGTPIYIRNVADVGFGAQIRQGATTKNGKGEVALGIAMLLKGENSRAVAQAVKARVTELQKSMPEGVVLNTVYDRSDLVGRTIGTASRNLIEGGLIVAAVLFLFMLQIRAGLIVSSAIPLAMLAAIIGMKYFDISANLMSLGAIDFGLIVDAAVILVENSVRRLNLHARGMGRALSRPERIGIIESAILEVRKSSQFGETIIIASYLPVLALTGIEGKMFRPMAFTVIFALCGALLLSLTLIPALCATFLREKRGSADDPEEHNPLLRWLGRVYGRTLDGVMKRPLLPLAASLAIIALAATLYTRLGSEFIPELDEGAILVDSVQLPSISVEQAALVLTEAEKKIMALPEVELVYSRIGRPEMAFDPMGPEYAHSVVALKPESQWRPGKTKADLVNEIDTALKGVPGFGYSFSQPIKSRMLELIEGIGSRSDVAVKIFGEDLPTLERIGREIMRALNDVRGGEDVRMQSVSGLPTLKIEPDRKAIARYGINIADVGQTVQSAIAGTEASQVFDGFKRFALVVRVAPEFRRTPDALGQLRIAGPNGQHIPIASVAKITSITGPVQLDRENAERRIGIEANVRGRDLGSFVEEAQDKVERELKLPPGYRIEWGGTYQNLLEGKARLAIAVPITFAIVLLLLFMTFQSARQAVLIFTGIPLAISGGVFALTLRDMPFSISAGVGFIAVSGVAVLNGMVLVAFINHLRDSGHDIPSAVREGCLTRLRPVLMTAAVASLGFLPMALSEGSGAEVQRPVATVVIGGLLTSTALTLVVLPILYRWFTPKEQSSARI